MSVVNNTEINQGLARAIEQRRRALHLTVSELARKAGVSQQGLMPLRRGEVRNYQERLTGPVCGALEWTPDSIDRLISGGEPVELDAATPPVDLAERVERLEQVVLRLGRAMVDRDRDVVLSLEDLSGALESLQTDARRSQQ